MRDIMGMMGKVKEMQAKMEKVQAEIASLSIEGRSGVASAGGSGCTCASATCARESNARWTSCGAPCAESANDPARRAAARPSFYVRSSDLDRQRAAPRPGTTSVHATLPLLKVTDFPPLRRRSMMASMAPWLAGGAASITQRRSPRSS